MATTYNVKQDARGYSSNGVTDWGLVSRHLDTLINVQLGSQFQSSRGLMVHVTNPLWDGVKVCTVRMIDIIPVEGEGEPPPPEPTPISLVYPPGALELRLVQPDGSIVIARNIETITLAV